MFRLIRASFNQRRKTLQNGLSNAQDLSFSKEEIAAAIESLGTFPVRARRDADAGAVCSAFGCAWKIEIDKRNIKKSHPYADSNLKGWDFLNFLLFLKLFRQ